MDTDLRSRVQVRQVRHEQQGKRKGACKTYGLTINLNVGPSDIKRFTAWFLTASNGILRHFGSRVERSLQVVWERGRVSALWMTRRDKEHVSR